MPTPLPLVLTAPRRGRPPTHLTDLDAEARRVAVQAAGQPAYRVAQLERHYYTGLTRDPARMTDLPAAGRAEFVAALLPELLTEVRSIACDAGRTRKTLWRAHDGVLIESVLMRYPDRITLCVSSQAGCGMACPFCATGQGGLTRNLSTGEIVEQVRLAAAGARDGATGEPGRLSNVVFMGMGEPLANYRRVLAALRQLLRAAPHGLGLSARSVTVSTVGLVPQIDQLAAERLPVTLAVSLHAPDDELRDTLVPINQRHPLSDVLTAARRYADVTGRRVSIEYALIRDVNDQAWRADLLGRRLHDALGQLVHVNLIPLNPTLGSAWDASDPAVQDEFVDRVRAAGVACTVRDTRGREIAAACGQLAASGV